MSALSERSWTNPFCPCAPSMHERKEHILVHRPSHAGNRGNNKHNYRSINNPNSDDSKDQKLWQLLKQQLSQKSFMVMRWTENDQCRAHIRRLHIQTRRHDDLRSCICVSWSLLWFHEITWITSCPNVLMFVVIICLDRFWTASMRKRRPQNILFLHPWTDLSGGNKNIKVTIVCVCLFNPLKQSSN